MGFPYGEAFYVGGVTNGKVLYLRQGRGVRSERFSLPSQDQPFLEAQYPQGKGYR